MGDIVETVFREVALLADPVLRLADPDEDPGDLLGALGINLDAVPELDLGPLRAGVAAVSAAVSAVTAATGPADLAAVVSALTGVSDVVSGLRTLLSADGWTVPPDLGAVWGPSTEQLLTLLVSRWLQTQHSVAHRVLLLLGVVDRVEATVDGVARPDGSIAYLPTAIQRVDVSALLGLVRDPGATLSTACFGTPVPPAGDQAVVALVAKLWPVLREVARLSGVDVLIGSDPAVRAALGDLGAAGGVLADATVVVPLGSDATLTATLVGPGSPGGRSSVVISLDGTADVRADLGPWSVALSATGGTGPVSIDSGGTVVLGDSPTAPTLLLTVARTSPGQPAGQTGAEPLLRIGPAGATHVGIADAAVTVQATFPDGAPARVSVEVALTGVTATLDLGDGDGLLQQVARTVLGGPVRAAADVTIGWAWGRGVYLHGGARVAAQGADGDLVADVPVGLDAGPLRIPTLHLRLGGRRIDGEEALSVSAGLDVAFSLGPVAVTVTEVGLRADLRSTPGTGNLGPLDASLAFKAPSGAGIAVRAPMVSGGGHLAIDAAAGRYTGVVALTVGPVTVQGVAVLTTDLPGGGWSLIALATVQGLSVQLGFGIELTGIGVLVGINRGVDVAGLQALARAGGLDTVMFPPDLARNAAAVAAGLDRLFPVAPGQFVLGPTVQLAWGAGPVVTAEVAVYVQLPAPLRILLLGAAHLTLPTRSAPVVDVTLDVLGVLDLAARTVALDMSLTHSSLAGLPLSGQAALRAGWGTNPVFVLAIGGFNPHFVAPAGFPELARLSLGIGQGDLTLRLSAYLAVTSNTVQLGARAALRAAAGGLELTACVAFDALVQFSPFQLEVDLHIAATITFHGAALLTITVDVHLTGPAPWHLTGQAKIHLLFWTVTIPISGTFGAVGPSPLVVAYHPLDDLVTAVGAAANWELDAPGGSDVLVMRGEVAGHALHPLGSISVRQRLLPLDVAVDHIGNRTLAGPLTLSLSVDATLPPPAPLTDTFAPAQFFAMTDARKLSSPSFEPHVAGLTVTAAPIVVPTEGGQLSSTDPQGSPVSQRLTRLWDLTVIDAVAPNPDLLRNGDFSSAVVPLPAALVGASGGPGGVGAGSSAAEHWTLWNNADATTSTALEPSARRGSTATMLRVATTAVGCGLVQQWGANDTGPVTALVSAWVNVVRGVVALGSGNGGSIEVDAVSTTPGTWELLQATNGVTPVNEMILYAADPAGVEFLVDSVTVRAVGAGAAGTAPAAPALSSVTARSRDPLIGRDGPGGPERPDPPEPGGPTTIRVAVPDEVLHSQLAYAAAAVNGAAGRGAGAYPGPFRGVSAPPPGFVVASLSLQLRGGDAGAEPGTTTPTGFGSWTTALGTAGRADQVCFRSEVVPVDPAAWSSDREVVSS